uniref:CSON001023 protein n=1 Tax=Culicoides sonorensis TaxID=179676 RepID=A0A336MK61_CULSO
MFSTKERLKRRTPKIGINRENFIKLLVEEFYQTTDIEAKEQVSANLANFAYDPINYDYLKQSNVLDLFLELLGHVNPVLVNHGITGICNFCLDPEIKEQLIDPNRLKFVLNLIKIDTEPGIACNCVTIIIFLLSPDIKDSLKEFTIDEILKNYLKSSDTRLKNLATILLEDLQKLEHTLPFKAGDTIKTKRIITQSDLDKFSEVSGDHNPIHKAGQQKSPIVHGAFLNSIISGIIGTQLPGPGTEVISQIFSFPNKCYPDKEIEIEVELKDTRKIMKIVYKCVQDGKIVFDGEARVMYKASSSFLLSTFFIIISTSNFAYGSTIRDFRQNALIDSAKFSSSLASLGRNLTNANNNPDLTPCTCGIFLTSQFKKGSTEQPTGNPVLMSEINQVFPCNLAGQKMCQNKCLDSIVKHLPNSPMILCGSVDRDIHKERAYLWIQNCSPKWSNTNLSAGREYCCKAGEYYKCPF